MRYLLVILAIWANTTCLEAQSFGIDPNFKPFFDITVPKGLGGGLVSGILEDSSSGKIFVVGEFDIVEGTKNYDGVVRLDAVGSEDVSFKGIGPSFGLDRIIQVNDTVLLLSPGSGRYFTIDSTGADNWLDWNRNKDLTVDCSRADKPFFFKNGSSLMSKHTGNNGACRIFQPPDTFPHRYLIKIDSLGLWDSTFRHETNQPAQGFMPYDSSRIWVYGHPGVLINYDSTKVDGLCRIYHDGRLDTTFKSPLFPSINFGNYKIGETEEEGKFILHGYFLTKDDTSDHISMARFNADGSLDTTFNNYGQNYSVFFQGEGGVASYARTKDNGYLIGGDFDTIQGVAKNRIAKLDSNGYLQSQYLTSEGPDSVYSNFGIPYSIGGIVPSASGGYYVYGDFLKWDGSPVQPLIRLRGLLVGESELSAKKSSKILIYPNPTDQDLFIKIESAELVKSIRMFDLLGKECLVSTTRGTDGDIQLSMSKLNKGVYVAVILFDDGSVFSRKIIKH